MMLAEYAHTGTTTPSRTERRRRRIVTVLAGVGLLAVAGIVAAAVGDGVPSIEASGGAGGGDITDVSVELPDTASGSLDAASSRSPGERGPVTCLVEDCLAWRTVLPGDVHGPDVLVEDGLVVAALKGMPSVDTGDGSGSGAASGTVPDPFAGAIVGIDAASGESRWKLDTDLPAGHPASDAMAVAGGRLLLVDAPGTVGGHALDEPASVWRVEVADAFAVRDAKIVGEDLLVVIAPETPEVSGWGERVLALDPETGVERWPSAAADRVVLTSAGPVLFATSDTSDAMWGLDPGDGGERWRAPIRTIAPRIRVLDGLVVLEREQVTVIDATDGDVVAVLPRPGKDVFSSFPAGDADGLVMLAADAVSHVGSDGSTWRMPVPFCCLGSSLDAGTVTVLSRNGALHRFARDDGRLLEIASGGRAHEATKEPVLLVGGYVLTVELTAGGRDLEVFAEEAWTGRRIARRGSTAILGLTEDGGLLLGDRDELVALRAPAALADAPLVVP
jgi:outer membrane protein assembly factor BamB